ncbi:MAG: GNAT family N-acetyltransferase, partial [Thermoplasmata archaeon]
TVPAPEIDRTHEVRAARPEELATVVDFWSNTREREELARHLEVLWEHPNPEEEILPVLAFEEGRPASAAVLHRFRGIWGLHAVATQPEARGRGAASTLVHAAIREILPDGAAPVAARSDHPRIRHRLERLGFHEIVRLRIFELDPKAELSFPRGPELASPPRWRPSRSRS